MSEPEPAEAARITALDRHRPARGRSRATATLATAVLGVLLLASAAPAQANVVVAIQGEDRGGAFNNTSDSFSMTGDDEADTVFIDEGFRGDVSIGPAGNNDGENSCRAFATRLCQMVIRAQAGVTVQGAPCTQDSAIQARCYYFRSEGEHVGQIRLGGGADKLAINQGPVFFADQPVPWQWTVDYGQGDDVISGGSLLTVPAASQTRSTVAGGLGNDTFKGTFAAVPWSLAGERSDGAAFGVCSRCADTFEGVQGGGRGMTIDGGQGDDVFTANVGLMRGGSGNDRITGVVGALETLPPSERGGVSAEGGLGDDVLTGSAGDDKLDGGPGADELIPLGGADELRGGRGSDRFILGQSIDGARDQLFGDAQDVADAPPDHVIYAGVLAGVTVHLDGSQPSTGDDILRDIEEVTATNANDVIFGSAAAETIMALNGRDRVEARGGDDVIEVADTTSVASICVVQGCPVDDTVDAGTGEDVIRAKDGRRDVVTCGTSSSSRPITIMGTTGSFFGIDFDTAALDLADDRVTDCEVFTREARDRPPAASVTFVRTTRRTVEILLRCPPQTLIGCRGTARADRGRAVRYALRRGARKRLRLSAPGGARTVSVKLRERDERGRARERQAVTPRRR